MSSGMPPPPPRRKEDLRKQALSGLLSAIGPGAPRPPQDPVHLPSAAAAQPSSSAYVPAKYELSADQPLPEWSQYWDERRTVSLPDRGGDFNVYLAGKHGPVILAIHGAGYTGLTWSLVAQTLKDKYRVVAPDLRGHGLTSATPDNDFSNKTMSEDVVALWHGLFPEPPPPAPTQTASDTTTGSASTSAAQTTPATGDPRATMIVGHSMGGAVAVWAAASKQIPCLQGCVVIDVVEGTALAALPHMMGVIAARPTHFPSPSAAVHWAVKTGMSRNKAAAAISMPSQIRKSNSNTPTPSRTPSHTSSHTTTSPPTNPSSVAQPTHPESSQGLGQDAVAGLIHTDLDRGNMSHASLMSADAVIQEGNEEECENEAGHTSEGGAGHTNGGVDTHMESRSASVDLTADTYPAAQHAASASTGPPTVGVASQPGSQQGGGAQSAFQAGPAGPTAVTAGTGPLAAAAAAGPVAVAAAGSGDQWEWRTNLTNTQPYWQEWYTGLSEAFLSLPMPKVLLLAGSDRLDKPLTIGQMQGKFQLVVLPQSGHAIQEDDAKATAAALDHFAKRHRLGAPPLAIPKHTSGLRPVLPVVAGPVLHQ